MFLRSLTLKGFKSFADPTTLELEPGLTVVVGPNGSGKSNIVDAVAWVLGAQGPRTVRSSRMEDVIFAGNGRRPPLGRAEVSLTIDNSSGLLAIGFTEVTITRTLFRTSGESEYAINGAPCRLLDVQELLSDTGVGRQQHVIVSQGNLDAVLDARPEDRNSVRVIVTSLSSMGSRPAELSMVRLTSARPRAGRLPDPAKMTSSILVERTLRGPWAPSTHATASTTLDFPLPLGPTTTVMPGSNSRVVVSAKDLKPLSVSDRRNMRFEATGDDPTRRGPPTRP